MAKKTYLVWTDDFSVGIESIDDQHKILFKIANDLFDEIFDIDTETRENPMSAYRKLQVYINEHFSYEEELFDEHEWEGKNAHRNQHAILIKQVEEMKEIIESSSDRNGSLRVLGLFKDWMGTHIKQQDVGYSKYLISKGVK